MASKKATPAQVVFGSVYGKQKSNVDQQIMREIARLEAQHAKRAVKDAQAPTPNGPANGSNVPAYHRYP